jgi:hypothetical protein
MATNKTKKHQTEWKQWNQFKMELKKDSMKDDRNERVGLE